MQRDVSECEREVSAQTLIENPLLRLGTTSESNLRIRVFKV